MFNAFKISPGGDDHAPLSQVGGWSHAVNIDFCWLLALAETLLLTLQVLLLSSLGWHVAGSQLNCTAFVLLFMRLKAL